MRLTVVLLAALAMFASVSAQAGTINYNEGQGSWRSTQCNMPRSPSALSTNPEARANDLNGQWQLHNAFAAAAQDYMNCVSQEAQRDANAAGQAITGSAQGAIQHMQAEVNASANSLTRQQASSGNSSSGYLSAE